MRPGFGPRERLILALDVASGAEALAWADRLGDSIAFYKIGMELLGSGEFFTVLEALAGRGKRVFVDLKFHDVPATVAGAVAALARWPVTFATLHAQHPAMMAAAAAARGPLQLLGVTVLTSIDAGELAADADPRSASALVLHRARAAHAAGLDGVVASGQEARALRDALGPEAAIVCPGVRPAGSARDDQKRTVDVAQAFAAGASHIVVGRPIRRAADPAAAAEAMQAEISRALSP